MDKKIRKTESILLNQIIVLNALNKTSPNSLTKESIFSILDRNNEGEPFVNTVLGTMISKGLISPSFTKGTMAYSITDFGNYFFAKFKETNEEYFKQQFLR